MSIPTDLEVYENLCVHDPRNPLYRDIHFDDISKPRANCSCDNCFYHRDWLAVEILRLRELTNYRRKV